MLVYFWNAISFIILCYLQQLLPKTYFSLADEVTMKLQIIKKKKPKTKSETESRINGVGKKPPLQPI